jgi:hypothetical protein
MIQYFLNFLVFLLVAAAPGGRSSEPAFRRAP